MVPATHCQVLYGRLRLGTAELTQILANISAIYSPELTVGYLPYVSYPRTFLVNTSMLTHM